MFPKTSVPSDLPFANAPFDRASHRRADAAWLRDAAASPDSQFMLFQKGRPLVSGGAADSGYARRIGEPVPSGEQNIVWLGPQAVTLSREAEQLFLGVDSRDRPVFALNLPAGFRLDQSPIAGLGVFSEMRAAAASLPAFEAQAAGTAKAIFDWRARHGYCANCGSPTHVIEAGWKRQCDDCGAEHFPRVDPVAIMLGVKGDRCLLGRQASWAPGFWSCLAGFIEPGETPEQGAARELFEESGVSATGRAEYLFTQPWPFPSSLMIGIILEVEDDAVRIDPSEIEEARWFTREEARAILAGDHPEAFAPPPTAIAHHILKVWAERG